MEKNSSTKKVLLIGNPNAGKSSLFNQLTGVFQKIANYPGVTTEKKTGRLKIENLEFEINDLPGCYSLYPNSIDEKVVIDELVNHSSDLIIFVADACNLHRSLLLYSQIADCYLPNIFVINMTDELARRGEKINKTLLENELGVPVFLANSKKNEGIEEIKSYLKKGEFTASKNFFGNQNLFERFKRKELKVLFFEIFDTTVEQYRQFYALPYNSSSGYRAPVFFELLAEGKMTLLTRESLEYQTVNSPYYYGSYSRLVLIYRYFLLEENGTIVEFIGKKAELMTLMGKRADAVEDYIKQNKLKIDNRNHDDFAKIVAYYNSFFKT